ncbi:MAG: F0F1 ATP synthase subunit delta [Candidatus Doudnabacteria bacterium]|nr:F0F1 ATP synthase subunit delta [Candidatus Doudnabacteria bacterium]
MKYTSKQYAQSLHEALSESSPKDQDKVLDNFVKILVQNGDIPKYSEIEKELSELILQTQGKKVGYVSTAREMNLSTGVVEELNESVKSDLEIRQNVESGLVGGLVLKVGDKLIDASIKEQLNKLSKSLQE